MELRSIQVVNDYIGLNNKLSDFLLAKLDKSVNINTYLNKQREIIDKNQNKLFVTQRYTVLHTAIDRNNINGVNWVIENGADINKKMNVSYNKFVYDDLCGYKIVPCYDSEISPLQIAMQNNFIFIAKILIDKGADTTSLTDDEKKKSGISVDLMFKRF